MPSRNLGANTVYDSFHERWVNSKNILVIVGFLALTLTVVSTCRLVEYECLNTGV